MEVLCTKEAPCRKEALGVPPPLPLGQILATCLGSYLTNQSIGACALRNVHVYLFMAFTVSRNKQVVYPNELKTKADTR